MYMQNIFVIFTGLICAQGFEIKLKYCRLRCGSTCGTADEDDSATQPEDYYWRDFYGIIPPDAYALGPSSQFPQTYIGLVYDPSKNGSFVTTIYEKLDYVYNVLNNETTKIDKHIQILCTQSPEKLSWIKLTSDNFKNVLATYKNVQGGHHTERVNNIIEPFAHFIVKTNKCQITYTGVVQSINDQLEYALIDGSFDITDQSLFLMYKEKEPAKNTESSPQCTPTSFFSHQSTYAIRPDSIIPKFYKQINVGSCSVTCTNDNNNMGKFKKDVKLSASMAYYWKPKPVIRKEEALLGGKDYAGPNYVGQAYITGVNDYDVGSSDLKSTKINLGTWNAVQAYYYNVLSTNSPDKFKWINTTTQEFSKQDKNKMIPGGALDNGTETFVCRENGMVSLPGSARVHSTGTYCYAIYGPIDNFQILIYDEEKE